MTCARDIGSSEALEREFESIRKVFATMTEDELPLRIEWGTKKAFNEADKLAAEITERINRINKSILFVEHLEGHIKRGDRDVDPKTAKVMCKFCGKTIDQIAPERLKFSVSIVPKTVYSFDIFKGGLDEIGELDEGHLEVKDTADGYEMTVDKDVWIRSYEERGCPLKEEEHTNMALAKIFADEIKGMIYETKVKVEVQVK